MSKKRKVTDEELGEMLIEFIQDEDLCYEQVGFMGCRGGIGWAEEAAQVIGVKMRKLVD